MHSVLRRPIEYSQCAQSCLYSQRLRQLRLVDRGLVNMKDIFPTSLLHGEDQRAHPRPLKNQASLRTRKAADLDGIGLTNITNGGLGPAKGRPPNLEENLALILAPCLRRGSRQTRSLTRLLARMMMTGAQVVIRLQLANTPNPAMLARYAVWMKPDHY